MYILFLEEEKRRTYMSVFLLYIYTYFETKRPKNISIFAVELSTYIISVKESFVSYLYNAMYLY